MDPGDVVRMAKLLGIELVALTDHNSTKNCPVAEQAAIECGIGFIAGTEVTTAEEIHCVCLFPSVERALLFGGYLDGKRPRIKNRRDIFGNQFIVHHDGTIQQEPYLLYTAADIAIIDLPGVVEDYGGVFWPAHIDRGSNSLLTVLGSWPEELRADAAEVRYHNISRVPPSIKRIDTSDGHRFRDMREGGFPLPLKTADFEGLAGYLKQRATI